MTDTMTPLLLTYDEAAKLLGMTTQALRDWVYKGKGPKLVRLGRSVRFRPAELEEWVEKLAMNS